VRTWVKGIRLSAVSTGLLTFGLGLLVVSVAGPRVNVGGTQVGPGASWWQRAIVAAVGVVAIAWAMAASREARTELRGDAGFLGTPPGLPTRLVERPDLTKSIAQAIIGRAQVVAVTGTGGSGKSTLAARACIDSNVRKHFPDGVTWFDAGPQKNPLAILADLARRLGVAREAIEFTTIEHGRDVLAAKLRGKRVLIALDNVWDRKPLDAVTGLASTCAVLFTTRMPNLAKILKADTVEVDRLTQDQALELLKRWAGLDQEMPLDIANKLCAGLGKIALGVAMAGAMVANGRSMRSVLDLIEHDLTLVGADLDPHYQYRTLYTAIEAGITDLSEANRNRYEQLAVFSGRCPFPADAAHALWQTELSEVGTEELLAELSSRSLLIVEGNGWYSAHDLQLEVLKRRIGDENLMAAHGHLLDGYRQRYDGWPLSASDHYLANELAGHLYEAGRSDELHMLLIDVDWIQARLAHGQMQDLLADYKYASDILEIQILRALRLSAAALASDARQVRGQLAGRLLDFPDRMVATWASGLAHSQSSDPWLSPLSPALTPTTTGLKQAFSVHTENVLSVAITPDGSTAVSGDQDGCIRVWDLTAGSQQASLPDHTGSVMALAITHDGAIAISGGGEGSVRMWHLRGSNEPTDLGTHSARVQDVAISPDDATAVTVDQAGSARVWDVASGRSRGSLPGHAGSISSVALTMDFAFTSCHDGAVSIWDLATRRLHAELKGHDGEILSIAVTPDGARLVGGDRDGSVWVWDRDSDYVPRKLAGHHGWIRSVSMTRDGRTAVTGGQDGMVRVWDLDTGRQRVELAGHSSAVLAVAVTPGGADAVTGGGDGSVRIWDLAYSRIEVPLSRPRSKVQTVAATPDGQTAISGGNRDLHVWDLASGRLRVTLGSHPGRVTAVALTPDGRTAISGSGDNHDLQVWDLAAGQIRTALTGHTGNVLAVATSDARMVVSGSSDQTVRVWNLAAGYAHTTLTGHTGWVRSVAISADEFTIVSGSDDGYIRLWNLTSGDSRAILAYRTGPAYPVAVAPDASFIVSGNRDGSIHIWETASTQEQARLVGHTSPITSVAVAPDASKIVSGDTGGNVYVWNLAAKTRIASWKGDHPIIMCIGLHGYPFKVAVGQENGQPYLLELRG
jgi:WD40 repeat protein